jgi:hypothetical protein
MNELKRKKKTAIAHGLVEGCSICSIQRLNGVHRDAILQLMNRVGDGCAVIMDQTMRNLPCRDIRADEIWGYVAKKQRHVTVKDRPFTQGDMWTYVAIDRDTELNPAYRIEKRIAENKQSLIAGLFSRLVNRVQLSSDALSHYVEAIEGAFGASVDYDEIIKVYEGEPIGPGRYSPPHVVSTEKKAISGAPNEAHIGSSNVKRQNLTIRTHAIA